MGNYVTECPACHKPLQVSTGLFAKKKLKCSCGYLIDVAVERMAEDIIIKFKGYSLELNYKENKRKIE